MLQVKLKPKSDEGCNFCSSRSSAIEISSSSPARTLVLRLCYNCCSNLALACNTWKRRRKVRKELVTGWILGRLYSMELIYQPRDRYSGIPEHYDLGNITDVETGKGVEKFLPEIVWEEGESLFENILNSAIQSLPFNEDDHRKHCNCIHDRLADSDYQDYNDCGAGFYYKGHS